MNLTAAALFILVVLVGVIAIYRSKKKKELFKKYMDQIQEKDVLRHARLYHYDAEGEAASASDVYFVKGGFIVFSLAMSHYFFKKGMEDEQLSNHSSLCGFIKSLKILDEHTFEITVEFTRVKDFTSAREYKLKFEKVNPSLESLLAKYSIT